MIKYILSKSHPRYLSLYYRDLLAKGVRNGITSLQGLTAHGRGEAFDYLIGEKTHSFAQKAIEAAAAMLLLSRKPVISVNGNTAALVPKELIKLAQVTKAKLEVNLFHSSKKRERAIVAYFKKCGAREVLTPDKTIIPNVTSNRKHISQAGQKTADVIFIPLEDGDRTEQLIKLGKKVITVDLNPLSRTAQKASVTIVDNIIRCLPLLIAEINKLKHTNEKELLGIVKKYRNRPVINQALQQLNRRLTALSGK
ncbi:phosphopantothenate/pantothenate synthetase [Candidatus Microgenomates bacterium]|nr:phosphopantothenate/pantothenate synthetase [Candidatus Microgenomates bacterium]